MKTNKEKIKWIKTVTRPVSPLIASSLIEGCNKGMIEIIGVSIGNQLLEPVGDKHARYFDEEEWKNFTKKISELSQDISFLEKQAKEAYRVCDEVKKVTSKICANDIQHLSNEKLEKLLNQYHKSLHRFSFYLFAMLIMDPILVSKLKDKLQAVLQNKSEKFNEYFEVLTTKTDLIEVEKEEIELSKIKARSRKGEDVDNLLESHAQRYSWLPMYDHDMTPWDEEYFRKRMMEFSEKAEEEIARREKELRERNERLHEILQELNDPELTQLTNILQKYIILRTYRTDVLRIGCYYNMDPFFREIGRRMGLKNREIAQVSIYEIFEFLRTDEIIPREVIKERKEHSLILNIGSEFKIISKKNEIDRILKEELERVELVDVLKGEGIYARIRQGRVKIIESIKDAHKIQPGDILVATMTTPEMHSIIGKAGAIVTDEGGITCHAAIVSRELKIPAVIATEKATKVFKDGDLVEVDSIKGIVRRLK